MTERLAYLNGDFLPEQRAAVSVFDAAVLFGETITETVRTFRHQPFHLENHLVRMWRSLKACRIDPPVAQEGLRSAVLELLARNDPLLAQEDDWRIDMHLTTGPFDLERETPAARPTAIITTVPLPFAFLAPLYVRGCHVVTPNTRWVPAACLDPRIKHHSRLHYRIGVREARLVDPDAFALMLDLDGNVAECTGGNFFIVQHGKLVTAPTTSVLDGVTRSVTIEIAARLGIHVEQRLFGMYDVYNADEAFQTSTPFCIMPVTRANRVDVANALPGPLTMRLMEEWNTLAGMDLVAQALRHARPNDYKALEELRRTPRDAS